MSRFFFIFIAPKYASPEPPRPFHTQPLPVPNSHPLGTSAHTAPFTHCHTSIPGNITDCVGVDVFCSLYVFVPGIFPDICIASTLWKITVALPLQSFCLTKHLSRTWLTRDLGSGHLLRPVDGPWVCHDSQGQITLSGKVILSQT